MERKRPPCGGPGRGGAARSPLPRGRGSERPGPRAAAPRPAVGCRRQATIAPHQVMGRFSRLRAGSIWVGPRRRTRSVAFELSSGRCAPTAGRPLPVGGLRRNGVGTHPDRVVRGELCTAKRWGSARVTSLAPPWLGRRRGLTICLRRFLDCYAVRGTQGRYSRCLSPDSAYPQDRCLTACIALPGPLASTVR